MPYITQDPADDTLTLQTLVWSPNTGCFANEPVDMIIKIQS